MAFYFAILVPLVAGVVALYGILPDLFDVRAGRGRKILAGLLIGLGAGTSIWAAYTGGKDQRYVASWQAVEDLHNDANRIWSNFRAAMFDTDRMELGAKILQEAGI